jgi:AraC family transcriptional regulator, arabinose operon regulatory protein
MTRTSSAQPPPYTWLLAGYFHRKRDYAVFRERGTDDWLLFFTLSGSGKFTHARGAFLAQPDDIMLYAPGALHDYALEGRQRPWEFLWFHFRPRTDWAELLRWPAIAPGLMHLPIRDRPLWKRMHRALAAAHRFTTTARRHSTLHAMHALEEFLLLTSSAQPNARPTQLDPRIEKTMEFVQRNLRQSLSRAVLAEQAGLSTHRFAHLFQEQVGKSPRQFVEEERLKLATHLLGASRTTLSEIAHEVGFPNLFYFSQRFKTARGLSPTAFRKSLKNPSLPMDAVD